MKQTSPHHEIIIFTVTSLVTTQLTNAAGTHHQGNFAAIEALRCACWNGDLNNIFPEIPGTANSTDPGAIRHVMTGKNFLYINLGPDFSATEHDTSIDPYLFTMNACKN